ncbi:competence protein ComEC [Anaeromicropila populeti]|uniref:Competence protein ComEC n=1 Tax=Anaeromicropila populeti TaxID=37658 RepID=A0A1I6K4S2_9FIRM|nr:competence protein ComEC [Anaeromicropila populeti]
MVRRPLIYIFGTYVLGIFVFYHFKNDYSKLIVTILFLLFIFSILVLEKFKYNQSRCFNFSFVLLLSIIAFYFFGMYRTEARFPGNILKLEGRETKYVSVKGIAAKVTAKTAYQEILLQDVCGSGIYFSDMIVRDKSFCEIAPGNEIVVSGTVSCFQPPNNAGQFNEKEYYLGINILYQLSAKKIMVTSNSQTIENKFLFPLKTKLKNSYYNVLPEGDAAMITAMVLGEKGEMNAEIKELYQKAGIAHILAISGLHISVLCLFFFQLLKKAGLHHFYASGACILLVYLYGILTGFGVSVIRSVIMMIAMMVGGIIGRTYDSKSAAALSGLLILLDKPLQLFQCGFLLSYTALLGILYIYPVLSELFEELVKEQLRKRKETGIAEGGGLQKCLWNFCHWIALGVLMGFSIQMATLPVILWFFYEFPPFSPFLNLLVLPFTTVLILLAFLAGILGLFWLPAGTFFAGSIHAILSFYELLCQLSRKIPYSTIIIGRPDGILIVLYYGTILLFLLGTSRKLMKFLKSTALEKWYRRQYGICFLLLLGIIFVKIPKEDLSVTFLDVGQGDCICIENREGEAILVDGGSTSVQKVGAYRMLPFLKWNGISRIAYCMVSHMDTDHIGGVREILEESIENPNGTVRIENLVMPDTNLRDEVFYELVNLAEQAGTKVIYMGRGSTLSIGNLKLECLHPYFSFPAQSSNAYSMVLSLRYNGFSLLLTGDLEEQGEQVLLDSGILSSYDVLKIAHHGSKFSTSEAFLKQIHPSCAVISCGEKNSYGHPHKELLNRLEQERIKTYLTMQSGAVAIGIKKQKVYISTQ